MRGRTRVLIGLLFAGTLIAGSARAEYPDYVYRTLTEAKAGARTVADQVRALIELAWPEGDERDPLVQAAARAGLVRYGHHALPSLRRFIPDMDPLYQADVVAAFVEARYGDPSGMPKDYLPGLEEAIWYGSPEARRIALSDIWRYSFPPAVLTSIDAAYLDPQLTRYVMQTLGRMGDPRAKRFLSEVLLEGAEFYKSATAQALEAFGEQTIDSFRSAVRSDDRTARESALRVLLPLADPDDLELLREYLARRTDDDPELLERARQRLDVLERRLAP